MEQLHLKIARNLVGMKEIGNNAGFDNKDFEAYITQHFKWRKGYSWCAYFVGFCLSIAQAKKPEYRGGLARGFYTHGFSPYKDISHIDVGDIIVWQKGDTHTGHVGIINKVIDAHTVEVIEGNTSASKVGSQDNGDGVYIRTRRIDFMHKPFHVLGFSKVSYE